MTADDLEDLMGEDEPASTAGGDSAAADNAGEPPGSEVADPSFSMGNTDEKTADRPENGGKPKTITEVSAGKSRKLKKIIRAAAAGCLILALVGSGIVFSGGSFPRSGPFPSRSAGARQRGPWPEA